MQPVQHGESWNLKQANAEQLLASAHENSYSERFCKLSGKNLRWNLFASYLKNSLSQVFSYETLLIFSEQLFK